MSPGRTIVEGLASDGHTPIMNNGAKETLHA